VKYWENATGEFPVVSEDDMLRKTIKAGLLEVEVIALTRYAGFAGA
jgi:hypothetical protein